MQWPLSFFKSVAHSFARDLALFLSLFGLKIAKESKNMFRQILSNCRAFRQSSPLIFIYIHIPDFYMALWPRSYNYSIFFHKISHVWFSLDMCNSFNTLNSHVFNYNIFAFLKKTSRFTLTSLTNWIWHIIIFSTHIQAL